LCYFVFTTTLTYDVFLTGTAERVSESVVSLLQSYGSKTRGPGPICLLVT